jgi:hypothetical protein
MPPRRPREFSRGETFDERVRTRAKKFIGRGEPGASEIMANLFDPDYLIKHELVFIGSLKPADCKEGRRVIRERFGVDLQKLAVSRRRHQNEGR